MDVDTSAYEQGHIAGAIAWNWQSQLCDNIRRDVLTKEAFEKLMSESGIAPDTTVVLYGDNNNWFACYAFWQLKLYAPPATPESWTADANCGSPKTVR